MAVQDYYNSRQAGTPEPQVSEEAIRQAEEAAATRAQYDPYQATIERVSAENQFAFATARESQIPHTSLRPLSTNPDRVVEINVISNMTSGTPETKSWRHFLARILTEGITQSADQGQWMFDPNSFSGLDVDKGVCLTVDSFPKFEGQLEGKLAAPLQGLLQKAQKLATGINALSAGISLFSGNEDSGDTSQAFAPYLINIPAYAPQNARGIQFQSTFKFTMGQYGLWNAKKEVVLPVLNLLAPTLLRNINPVMQQGPFPSIFDLTAKVLKELWAGVTGNGSSNNAQTRGDEGASWLTRLGDWLETLVLNTYDGFIYQVQYGRFMKFNNVILRDAKVNWNGNEVDQYGYPVSSEVQMTFETIAPPALSSSSYNSMALRFGVGTATSRR